MDAYGKLIDILVFCAVGFLLPAILVMFLADSVKETYSDIKVRAFAENVSTKGYVDYTMYESFIQELNAAGVIVSPEIYVEHESLAPEYVMRTIDDAEGYLEGLYGGSNILNQPELSITRPYVYDPGTPPAGSLTGNVSGTDTSTTGSAAGHTHTAGCFQGTQHFHDENCPSRDIDCDGGCTKHQHTGNSSSGGGCYGQYRPGWTSTEVCGAFGMTGTSSGGTYTCSGCGGTVEIIYVSYACSGCGMGGSQPISNCATCNPGPITLGTGLHYPSYPGYYSINCGKNNNAYYTSEGTLCTMCGGDGKVSTVACTKTDGGYYLADGTLCTPLCDKVVTGITPLWKEQVIAAGEPLDSRVKAGFSDGHTEIVNATVSGFDSTRYNVVQTVTLSYGTYMGDANTTGATTVTIKVMVRYPLTTCAHGHMYYQVNGSVTLCPYCKAYPQTLELLGVTQIPFCIIKGTTLSDNGVQVKAIYYDGHYEILSHGWMDNLDRNYVGEQDVVIAYKGATTTLKVKNERIKVTCSVCGYEYSLYPDNTDPGCPKCLSVIPVFTGNVLRYKETVSHGEILDELYHGDGIYYFSRGDRFETELWKTAGTSKNTVFGRLFGSGIQEEFVCMYGVKIRDEEVEK